MDSLNKYYNIKYKVRFFISTPLKMTILIGNASYINVSILSKLFCFRNYSFINPPPQFLNSKIFKF